MNKFSSILFLILMTSFTLLNTTAFAKQNVSGKARLEILPPSGSFPKDMQDTEDEDGEDREIILTATLKNIGKKDLWINGRMALNTPHAPEPHRELWLKVQGPDRQELSFGCKIRIMATQDKYYQVLRVREEKQFGIRLSCYDLSKPGRYKIVLNYQDGNPEPPPAPPGTIHLKEALQAKPIEIEITD